MPLAAFLPLALACGGCLSGSEGRAIPDPLVTVRRYDVPGLGIDYLRLWSDLGIRSQLFAGRGDGITNTPVTAEVVALGQVRSETWKMIRLKDVFGWDWQYLLCVSDGRRWSYAGHVDFAAQPYVEPACLMTTNANGSARLRFRYVSAHGTDVYDTREIWYTLRSGGTVGEDRARER